MTCSKIFSGDLPELTYEVIKYFQNDYSTLHSCILVNRLWCRLAIPLLWENPFSIGTGNYNFIEIYLNNLDNDLKTKLNEYKIINNSLPSNLLFNYLKFLKFLNINTFILYVERWFEVAIKKNTIARPNNLTDICVPLFKIFIENEINLYTLEINVLGFYHFDITSFDKILELILKNTNFILNISNLNLNVSDYFGNIRAKNILSQIINLHKKLKKILICYYNLPIYQSLLISIDSNCSNSLNKIILYCINFKFITYLDKIFEQLNTLESVHIIYCSFLNNSFIQKIINLTKPLKLKSLFMNDEKSESNTDESLLLLLQKSGCYLENIEFGNSCKLELEQQIFESVINYCKNIKFLRFDSQIAFQISSLTENIKHNLNYLSINDDLSSVKIRKNSTLLQDLGSALPSKLEYLSLNLFINVNDFMIFLEDSQDIFINKLIIIQRGWDDILHYIKEYIMKEKRIKYLAFMKLKNSIELYDLKNEVKEFKLHNIIVQNYVKLYINAHDFIVNTD
ncbi:unnamed protein product [Rhizophagus irregularis]|nr:unnamed protein product [Rhizophagus irregularis]